MSHKYSRVSYLAMKNYYQCLQIGHMINQLLIYSTEFQKELKSHGKLTVKHLWLRLIGLMIWKKVDEKKLRYIDEEKVQIRFVT